jgi:hypothetical protein
MPESHQTPLPRFTGMLAESVVVLVADGPELTETVAELCGFLRIRVVRLRPGTPLAPVLHLHRPMAVLCSCVDAEDAGQDVLAEVAAHDPALPVLQMDDDAQPRTRTPADVLPELVNFLFLAGRRNGTGRMMPV